MAPISTTVARSGHWTYRQTGEKSWLGWHRATVHGIGVVEKSNLSNLLTIMENGHHPLHSTLNRQRGMFTGRRSCSLEDGHAQRTVLCSPGLLPFYLPLSGKEKLTTGHKTASLCATSVMPFVLKPRFARLIFFMSRQHFPVLTNTLYLSELHFALSLLIQILITSFCPTECRTLSPFV